MKPVEDYGKNMRIILFIPLLLIGLVVLLIGAGINNIIPLYTRVFF